MTSSGRSAGRHVLVAGEQAGTLQEAADAAGHHGAAADARRRDGIVVELEVARPALGVVAAVVREVVVVRVVQDEAAAVRGRAAGTGDHALEAAHLEAVEGLAL